MSGKNWLVDDLNILKEQLAIYHKTCKYVVEGEPEHKHRLLKEVIGSCKIVLSLRKFVLCLISKLGSFCMVMTFFPVVEILERGH